MSLRNAKHQGLRQGLGFNSCPVFLAAVKDTKEEFFVQFLGYLAKHRLVFSCGGKKVELLTCSS